MIMLYFCFLTLNNPRYLTIVTWGTFGYAQNIVNLDKFIITIYSSIKYLYLELFINKKIIITAYFWNTSKTHKQILYLLSALSSPNPTDNRYSDVFFILYKQKYK